MSASRPGLFRRLWRLVDGTRRLVMNLLFLALLGAGVWTFAVRGPAALQDKTTLVLNLRGPLVEQQRYGFNVPKALVDDGLLVAPIGWGNTDGLINARR